MDDGGHEVAVADNSLDALMQGSAGALLDALMAYVPSGITIAAAPDVRILRVSDAGAALLARPREQLEGIPAAAHVEAYQVFRSDGTSKAEADELPLTRATVAGEVVNGEEWLVRAEDGRMIPILCNAGPIRDSDGRVIGGVITWADLTKQKALEQELNDALALSEALFAELNHRVRNHLQLVGSIVHLEGRTSSGETSKVLKSIEERLAALTAAYDSMRGALGRVQAEALLTRICKPLRTDKIEIHVHADAQLEIDSRDAPTLGIIVNEAVCNALKHAFLADQKGRIEVSLTQGEGGVLLRVSDDGNGLDSQPSRPPGMGQKLMQQLGRSLGGTINLGVSQAGGVEVTATFTRLG